MIKKNHTRKAHFRVTLDGEQRKIENVTVMSADEHKRTHTHSTHQNNIIRYKYHLKKAVVK